MKKTKVEALYRELGPTLYARAKRVLSDDAAAEQVTMDVVKELATLGEMPKLELARRARALVKQKCQAHSGAAAFDSLVPGLGPRK